MFQLSGHEVRGFTRETFQRALARAAAEGLRAERSVTEGAVDVISGNKVYQASRDRCSCIAGRYYKPCKHRALRAFLVEGIGLDITQGIAGARVRPEAVAKVADALDAQPALPALGPLGRRVRAGWTADRTWMRAYGVDV
jgi:hypothetical protein